MLITLPEDLQRQIEFEVAAGRAKSVEAVVEGALRAHLASLAGLRRSLDEAEADYREHGGVAWEDVKVRIAKRLANAG